MIAITREEVAKRIHWARLVWIAGLTNPLMILPQLYQIWRTKEIAGISLWFLLVLFSLQAIFSIHGYFIRDRMVMVSNGLAALTTALVVISVAYFNWTM